MSRKSLVLLAGILGVASAAACGDDPSPPENAAAAGDVPAVVVTTTILGDVVAELVGDLARVETIMPRGASPHDFQASAQQAAAMRQADALVVNGAGFEEGLLETIESAAEDGVPTFEAISAVATLDLTGDEAHEDEAHEDEAHESVDPHFFTDPSRVRSAAEAILDFLVAEVPGFDETALRDRSAAYLAELDQVDADVEEIVATVPSEQRKLVTNHEVFSYFAERYDFEVVGAVIPGGGTQAEASAAELAELAELVAAEGVPAVFADTSSPDRLAAALANEANRPGEQDVEVVELFSESLGPEGSEGASYLDMVRTNAQRIADALRP